VIVWEVLETKKNGWETWSQIHATGNVRMRVRDQKVLNNEPVKGCIGNIINATIFGNVTVETEDEVMCELNNIRVVLGLVKNIISINQLRSDGWKIEEVDGGGFNLTRNDQILKFERVNENNLCYIHANTVEVNNVSQLENARIIKKSYNETHDQWGHHGVTRLQAMAELEGVKLVGELTTCHACGMAKACRAKVAKLTTTKADNISERFFCGYNWTFCWGSCG